MYYLFECKKLCRRCIILIEEAQVDKKSHIYIVKVG